MRLDGLTAGSPTIFLLTGTASFASSSEVLCYYRLLYQRHVEILDHLRPLVSAVEITIKARVICTFEPKVLDDLSFVKLQTMPTEMMGSPLEAQWMATYHAKGAVRVRTRHHAHTA